MVEKRTDYQRALSEFVEFCERRHIKPERAIMAAVELFKELDPESREKLILQVTGEAEKAGEVARFSVDRPRKQGDKRLRTGIVARIG